MPDYKSIRNMSDKEVSEWFDTTYFLFRNAKLDDMTRNERYLKIYQALDNPDFKRNIGSGKISGDPKRKSNTYLPIGAAVVDANVSKLYRFLFPSEEYMKITGENWEDAFFEIKATAHQLKQHKEMKFRYTSYMALLEASIYDYAITGVSWKLQSGYVGKREKTITHKMLGKVSTRYQTVKTVQKWYPDAVDRPNFFRIPFFKCYHDPGIVENGFEDSTAFFDYRDVQPDDLFDNARTEDRPWGKYKNIDKVRNAYNKRIDKLTKGFPQDLTEMSEAQQESYNHAVRIRVRRGWTRDHIIEKAEGEIISRVNISGWPLQLWKMFDIPGQFKGMSILRRMERNQYDINAQINNRRDHENLIVDPIAVLSQDIISAEGAPIIHPGKVFVSPNANVRDSIWVHNPGPSPFNDANDLITNMKIIEMVTISQTDMGAVSKGRTTAHEIRETSEGADNKTLQRAQIFEELCLEPAYGAMFMLSQLLMTKDQAFKHFGKEGETMFLMTRGDYAFRSVPRFHALGTSDILNDAIALRNFLQAIREAATNPGMFREVNWKAVTTELFAKLVPKHYQAFVKDDREPSYTMNPADENKLFAMGQTARVSPDDDHDLHGKSHNGMKRAPDYASWPQRSKNNLDNHILEHNQGAAQQAISVQQNIQIQDDSDADRGIREVAG